MKIAPPRPPGPPLNSLRAFEAAARLGGFAAAAYELGVTPAAIAQQIKSLEAWTKTPLFERRSRGVSLTPFGARIAGDFTSAFDSLGAAVQELRAADLKRSINIAALPSIAKLWLSPRLPRIRSALKTAEISVTALERRPNLLREPYDLSIFFESPDASADLIPLSDDKIFPVCSPQIAKRLKRPDDLFKEVLLHDAQWGDDWTTWMKSTIQSQDYNINGPIFSLYDIALSEAINGAGVLMGHEPLVKDDLVSGKLVAPFKKKIQTNRKLVLEFSTAAKREPDLLGLVALLK